MFAKLTLENEIVALEPIDASHIEGLCDAGRPPEIWQYMPVRLDGPGPMQTFVDDANRNHADGKGLYFVVIAKPENRIVGATGFWNAEPSHRRVEIGFTWITPGYQQTRVNTACKLLLMTHAFETIGLNRVEFKTDSTNQKSRAALLRIGAREEGTLRRHMVQPDGRLRDSVYFSVIREEWSQVKANLEKKLS